MHNTSVVHNTFLNCLSVFLCMHACICANVLYVVVCFLFVGFSLNILVCACLCFCLYLLFISVCEHVYVPAIAYGKFFRYVHKMFQNLVHLF